MQIRRVIKSLGLLALAITLGFTGFVWLHWPNYLPVGQKLSTNYQMSNPIQGFQNISPKMDFKNLRRYRVSSRLLPKDPDAPDFKTYQVEWQGGKMVIEFLPASGMDKQALIMVVPMRGGGEILEQDGM